MDDYTPEIGEFQVENCKTPKEGKPKPPQQDRYYTSTLGGSMDAARAKAFLEHSIEAMNIPPQMGEPYKGGVFNGHEYFGSGSTVTAAVVTSDAKVVTAHLGDSPAIAFIYDPNKKTLEHRLLTKPHSLTKEDHGTLEGNPGELGHVFIDYGQDGRTTYLQRTIFDEEGKLISSGVMLECGIGDMRYGEHMHHKPTLKEYDFSEDIKQGKRVFLMVASDGIYSQNHEADYRSYASVIKQWSIMGVGLDKIVEHLVRIAALRSSDDITATLTEVKPNTSCILSVFDGHGDEGHVVAHHAKDILEKRVKEFEIKTPPPRWTDDVPPKDISPGGIQRDPSSGGPAR